MAPEDTGTDQRREHHAQTARNLGRSLGNAAAGARLLQAEGLDSKSTVDVAATLADALEELHRLKRSLERRIRREQGHSEDRTCLEPPEILCRPTRSMTVRLHRSAEDNLRPLRRPSADGRVVTRVVPGPPHLDTPSCGR